MLPAPPVDLDHALLALGIFPLPQVTLLPGALLPLHVFEPRYRALVRDTLARPGRLLGVPMLAPGFEEDYEGRPPVLPICGVGEIIESRALADGRYDIVVQGLCRTRIEAEHPPAQPYRVVRAVRLADAAVAPVVPHATSLRSLVALCDRLAEALDDGGPVLRAVARRCDDPGAAADVIAAAVATDPADRQAALELLDVGARLDHVSAVVARLIERHPGGRPRRPMN